MVIDFNFCLTLFINYNLTINASFNIYTSSYNYNYALFAFQINNLTVASIFIIL